MLIETKIAMCAEGLNPPPTPAYYRQPPLIWPSPPVHLFSKPPTFGKTFVTISPQ